MSSVCETLWEYKSRPHSTHPSNRCTMVVMGNSFALFLRTKRRDARLLFAIQGDFVEVLSNDSWCSKLAYLTDIFHEPTFFHSGMQGKKENNYVDG